MKIKFNRQITVDCICNNENDSKTFYENQVVECESFTESIRGFFDIELVDGSVAIGVPRQGFTIL